MTTDNYSESGLKAVAPEMIPTTACVTGALAGLDYGSTIPGEWFQYLARKNDILKFAEDFTESLKKQILHGKS
jgi:hypothetical protein